MVCGEAGAVVVEVRDQVLPEHGHAAEVDTGLGLSNTCVGNNERRIDTISLLKRFHFT